MPLRASPGRRCVIYVPGAHTCFTLIPLLSISPPQFDKSVDSLSKKPFAAKVDCKYYPDM